MEVKDYVAYLVGGPADLTKLRIKAKGRTIEVPYYKMVNAYFRSDPYLPNTEDLPNFDRALYRLQAQVGPDILIYVYEG
jgi:hypothetical protein